MSKRRLYGMLNSRTLRALWAAEECALDFEHVELDLSEDGVKSGWFGRLNPNGLMPVFEDSDVTIWESLAITLYIAKRYGSGLYPAAIADEARTWQWTLWTVAELEPHVVTIFEHRSLLPPEQRSEDVARFALRAIRKPLTVLDQALRQRSFLVTDRFTIADLNVAAVLLPLLDNQWAVVDHPNIMAWLSACWARPVAAGLRNRRTMEKMRAREQYWTFFRSKPPE